MNYKIKELEVQGKNRVCNVQIYAENNIELKNIDLQPFDVAICDGPYGVLEPYDLEMCGFACDWDNFILNSVGGSKRFRDYYRNLFDICLPHLKESASIFVCGYPEGMHVVKSLLDEEYDLNFRRWITWVYDNHYDFDRGSNFHRSHEVILYYTKSTKGFTFRGGGMSDVLHQSIIKHESKWTNEGDPNYIKIGEEFKDGAKPLEVIRYLLSSTSCFKGRLLSLFAGSGTDLIVAAEHDMDSVGFEFNQKHIDVIINRLTDGGL